MSNYEGIEFSSYLFWDADKDKLDYEINKAYIIERVLSHGLLTDWYKLKSLYGLQVIKEVVLQLRYLDKYSLHFCSAYFSIPLNMFRCYKPVQSTKEHWVY